MQAYSLDDETFNYFTFGELLDAANSDDELYLGMPYYVAEICPFAPESSININRILEVIDDDLYEEIGEFYDSDFSNVSDEAKTELKKMICEWTTKHVKVERYFKFIGKSKRLEIEESDL